MALSRSNDPDGQTITPVANFRPGTSTPSRPRCQTGTATPPGMGPDGVGWIQL
jgi:hypothetical protein